MMSFAQPSPRAQLAVLSNPAVQQAWGFLLWEELNNTLYFRTRLLWETTFWAVQVHHPKVLRPILEKPLHLSVPSSESSSSAFLLVSHQIHLLV